MNIVDEMARAIGALGDVEYVPRMYQGEARAAAAVVAKRLQEAMAVDRAGDYWLGRNMVHAIITELEGK